MKIKNLALAALAAFAFTQSASATTITYVGTEEASGTANWSSVGVAKTYSIAGSNKYGTAGYYQICPMATPSNDPISVSDGNDLGVTASPWPTLYVKPAFVSAISGFAGTLVRYGYPLFRGPDGSTLYNQGALSVNLPNGGTSPSGPGNWGNTFQFTLGQSGSFRLGMAVDAVAAGTYAPNYISVYSAATGTVFSGPIARDATPKMVFFDIVGNAGDVFGIAQWQVGGTGPSAMSLITFDVWDNLPIWKGSISGNLGGSDANFTGKTFAQVLAATNVVYFGNADGLGAPVTNTTVTTVAGGVSAPTFQFDNSSGVNYTLGSADATGITGGSALLKTGNGALTLTAANTYTGATTVSNGVLKLYGPNANLSASTTVTVGSGAQLWFQPSGDSGTYNYNSFPIKLTQSTVLFYPNNVNTYNVGGNVTVAGGVSFYTYGIQNQINLGGVFSGTGNLSFTSDGLGSHTFTITGDSSASGYAGAYKIYSQNAWNYFTLSGGNNRLPITATVDLESQNNGTAAILDLHGNSQQLAGLTSGGVMGNDWVNNSGAGTPTLTLNIAGANVFSGVLGHDAPSFGLTKTGPGTLTLTGANGYTGPTTISAGELQFSTAGACANSAVTVVAGATNGVQLASANGQWTCAGLTYNAGNTYADFDFNNFAPSATTAPLNTGALTANSTVNIRLRNVTFPTVLGSYPLIHYTGANPSASSFSLSVIAGNAAGVVAVDAVNKNVNVSLQLVVPNLSYTNATGTTRQIAVADLSGVGLVSSQGSPVYTISLPSGTSANGGRVITDGTKILFTLSSYGNDSFRYTVSDGVNSATAAVNIICSTPDPVDAAAVAAQKLATLTYEFNHPYPSPVTTTWGQAGYCVAAYTLNQGLAQADAYVLGWDAGTVYPGNFTMFNIDRIFADPVLFARMSPAAQAHLQELMWNYINGYSKLADTTDFWILVGSENLNLARREPCCLIAQVLSKTPGYSNRVLSDGYTIQQHAAAWTAFFRNYFWSRARKGLEVEINSVVYVKYTLNSMYNLYDLTTDPVMKANALNYLNLYWAEKAQSYMPASGVVGGSRTRCSKDILTGEPFGSAIAGLGWNNGGISASAAEEMELVTKYLCPPIISALALANKGRYMASHNSWGWGNTTSVNGTFFYGISFEPDGSGGAVRMNYSTDDYIMSATCYRPDRGFNGEAAQNRMMGVTFNSYPDRIALIARGTLAGGTCYADANGMVGTNCLVLWRDPDVSSSNGEYVYLTSGAMADNRVQVGNWQFTQNVKSYVAILVANGGWTNGVDANLTGGVVETLGDMWSPVIIESAPTSDYASFQAFQNRILANPVSINTNVSGANYSVTYTSTAGEQFVAYAQSTLFPKKNGANFSYALPETYVSPYLNGLGTSDTGTVTYSNYPPLTLSFLTDSPSVVSVGVDGTTGANWRTGATLDSNHEYGTLGYVVFGLNAPDGTYVGKTYDISSANSQNAYSLPAGVGITGQFTTMSMWSGTGNFGYMQNPGNGNVLTATPLLENYTGPNQFTITRATSVGFQLTVMTASGDNENITQSVIVDDGDGAVGDSYTSTTNGLVYHVFNVAAGTNNIVITLGNANRSLTGIAFDALPQALFWDNNGSTAGFGTAGGTWTALTAGNSSQGWSADATGSTIPVDVTTFTGYDLNFGNGATGLGAGNIMVIGTVNAGSLTFASGSGDITLAGGTIANTGAITINNAAVTINSVLGGTSLTKGGTGTLTLTDANTYSDATNINTGTLKLGADNVLPSGAGKGNVNVNAGVNTKGTLNLNGFNLAINGLGGSTGTQLGRVLNNATGTTKTLTVGNNNANGTFNGFIANNAGGTGTVAVTKVGTGTQTLTGPNTYTGATTVVSGTLALGASNVLGTTPVSLGTATLGVGAGFTDTTGTLKTTGTATINLGSGTSALAFANSSGVPWSGTLNLTGTFVSGVSLRFGTNGNGLTATQLALISSAGFGSFSLNTNGYLIANTVTFATWQTANSTAGTFIDDHDNDGVPNGIEYFLGGSDNTTGPTPLPAIADSGGTLSITWKKAATYAGTYGIQFWIETTDTLTGTWTTESLGVNVAINGNNVTYTFPATGDRRFARLKVANL